MIDTFSNPFRPGAGHPPPFLAGRQCETNEFLRLLEQPTILENLVLTGLRGTGKTVLLESFKPQAIRTGWHWAGTDFSESASISEDNFVKRLLTDLSLVTSNTVIQETTSQGVGFNADTTTKKLTLNYALLLHIYDDTPGLVADKLKTVLEFAWKHLDKDGVRGLVFAYDEAQNLSDQAEKEEYPLSVLLDVFQSLQRKGLPLLLLLVGLPTLFPKLVKSRTYSERMFHIIELGRLDRDACREAILRPIDAADCPVKLSPTSVDTIINLSGGYPYFIQFICKEVYDSFLQNEAESVPVDGVIRKLDADFFMGRWSRATDRQRDLLTLIAQLENTDAEFTVREIVDISKVKTGKSFSGSGVNQMLNSLSDCGLVFKNRRGKYSFAVPLMGQFILREAGEVFDFDEG